jgi:hypothetical protein
MNLPPQKICRLICQLHALLGSPNKHEAASALDKLHKLMSKHGLSWNDLPAILATDQSGPAAAPPPVTGAPQVNVLDLVLRLLELYVTLNEEQRMAVALWTLHCHVFGRFTFTPRLALLSPVRGCGKTTLLVLLEQLTANPYSSDNVSAAAIYHTLAYREHTLLLDEGDNLGLFNNSVLRSVFNGGHRRGRSISRVIGGRPCKFSLFAPLAVAAIGELPLPLMQRAISINMHRHAKTDTPLQELNEDDPTFSASRDEIRKWAATCSLTYTPDMPPELRINRGADNWRVLVAIADDLGHGKAARAAAVTLHANRPDEDLGVVLLTDIRTVFDACPVDRISSAGLIECLVEVEDGIWYDYRGPNDDRPSRKLNQSELARLLRRFQIRPRTIWPANRQPGDRSSRGYMRSQFEQVWSAYCSEADTPTHTMKIKKLARS